MFRFYGTKAKIIHFYPEPKHDLIIEPFAGAAAYSCKWGYDKEVYLYDIDENVVDVWEYLIQARKSDILQLPLLKKGEKVSDCNQLSAVEKKFIGFMIVAGNNSPRNTTSRIGEERWTVNKRNKIALTVEKIKHWKIFLLDYKLIKNTKATWFIDPPYFTMGKYYRKNLVPEEYSILANYCKERYGQVIACENSDATWLPFKNLVRLIGQRHTFNTESIWTNQDITLF